MMFEEMVGNGDKYIMTISTCTVSLLVLALKTLPYKVLKKLRNAIHIREPATIKQAK